MIRKNTFFILILIVFLAAILRFPFLDKFPNGFSGDEAITGYSAYSILKTGKDEWGEFLPLTFRSFGDYKPGLYTYLAVPSIAVFGLSEFAVRLPAAILGVLSVLIVYFLAKQLFKSEIASLVACLLLAVNPWHFHFSRIAFEGGLTAFLFPAGLLFYLKSFDKPKFLPLSFVFWGLNLFSYLPARLFTILAGLAIFIVKRPQHLTSNTKVLTTAIIFVIVVFWFMSSRAGSFNRFLDISIFSINLRPLEQVQSESTLPQDIARLFDNKATFYFTQFFENYLSYFSPTFLFTGLRPEYSYLNLPGAPLLFGIEAIFLTWAIFFAFQKPGSFPLILLFWLFLVPIPAALTKDGMSLHRVTSFLPLYSLISAYGATNLAEFIGKKIKLNLTPILIMIILIAASHFFQNYFFHLPKRPPESARFGYRETISFIESVKRDYDKIIFSKSNSEPQAFVAFYTKMDPHDYQKASRDFLRYEKEGKVYLDQLARYSLGKYEFRDIEWDQDKGRPNLLMVGRPEEFPSNVSGLKTVHLPNGEIAFRIVESEVKR